MSRSDQDDRFRVLVVCTANQGRSPLAMAFLRRHLHRAGLEDAVVVASAGRMEGGVPISREVVDAAGGRGVDVEGHRSTQLAPGVLAGTDLVLVMAAEHFDDVGRHAGEARPPSDLLVRFVRNARTLGPRREDQAVEAYVAEVVRRSHSAPPTAGDEIEDPYGHPLAFLHATAARLDRLTGELVALLWPPGL